MEHYPELVDPQAGRNLLTPIGYLQWACRQGAVAEAEERSWRFRRATPRSFSSSRPRGRAGICEIAVNARSGSELDHARSARTPGIA